MWAALEARPRGEGVFEVVESYDPRRGYGSTKTPRSERRVPIPPMVAAILRDMRARTKWNGPEHPVFATNAGRPINRNHAQTQHLRPTAEALGLQGVCWHSLRHTLATMIKNAGVDIGDRELILGHATDEMALHYSHAAVEDMRKPLEQISERLLMVEKAAA